VAVTVQRVPLAVQGSSPAAHGLVLQKLPGTLGCAGPHFWYALHSSSAVHGCRQVWQPLWSRAHV
jgi:hypothetical protein